MPAEIPVTVAQFMDKRRIVQEPVYVRFVSLAISLALIPSWLQISEYIRICRASVVSLSILCLFRQETALVLPERTSLVSPARGVYP